MAAPKRTAIKAHRTNYHVGRLKFLQFIVIHDGETNEGTTPAEGMGSWFAQDHGPGRRSSAHQGVDTDSICTYVADKDTAFGAPGVNSNGWHLEHAGRAAQTASQWDDADSRLIVAHGALAAAEASVRLAPLTADRKPIPAVWLTDAQLRAAQTNPLIKGFITHRQASRVLGGTHTDPGKFFPEPKFMTLVRSHLGGPTTTKGWDEMASQQEITDGVLKADVVPSPMFPTNPTVTPITAWSYAMQWSLAGRNAAQLAARDSAAALEIVKAMATKGSALDLAEVEAATERGVAKALADSVVIQGDVTVTPTPETPEA